MLIGSGEYAHNSIYNKKPEYDSKYRIFLRHDQRNKQGHPPAINRYEL